MPQLDVMRRIFVEQAAAHAKEILDPVKEAANEAGIECDTVVATGNSPYATTKVLTHSKIPVLVVR